jgi:uncharacterized membrane protein
MDQPEPHGRPAPVGRVPREAPTSVIPPVQRVPASAPLAWLRLGWRDFRAAGSASLFYGLVFAAMGRALTFVFGRAFEYVWALTSGFMLMGPFLALGVYELSRRLERGERPLLGPSLVAWRPNLASLGLFGLLLGVLLLLWSRASLVVIAVSFPDQLPTLASFAREPLAPDHLQFLAGYAAVGGLFASLVFAMSVVAVPMMLDRGSDGIVAALTSLRACAENPWAMLCWGALITLLTAVGFACFHLGLAIVVPIVGHATRHAYREIVGATPTPT